MNTPREQIANQSAWLREVETDMDDLVLQFDGTGAGKHFIEAWKHARIIVDSGGGHAGIPPTPPTHRHTETVNQTAGRYQIEFLPVARSMGNKNPGRNSAAVGGEATFSRTTKEAICQLVHGSTPPVRTVPLDVFALA
jgi:hypothetical protein